MCELSGGQVHNTTGPEFSEALTESLQQKFHASQVEMKIRLHPLLKFRNEAEANLSNNGSLLTKMFGNVDKPIDFCFEY